MPAPQNKTCHASLKWTPKMIIVWQWCFSPWFAEPQVRNMYKNMQSASGVLKMDASRPLQNSSPPRPRLEAVEGQQLNALRHECLRVEEQAWPALDQAPFKSLHETCFTKICAWSRFHLCKGRTSCRNKTVHASCKKIPFITEPR